MKHLHKHRIIHRDLKPGNVLIDKDFRPHISDFGLSKYTHTGHSNEQSKYLGTTSYMAPEIIQGDPYDGKVDVYAFGILMYQVLTDKKPYPLFDTEHKQLYLLPSQVAEKNLRPSFEGCEVKQSHKELIEKCWSSSPKERPTFEEIFNKLAYNIEESIYGCYNDDDDGDDGYKYYLNNVDVDLILSYADFLVERGEENSLSQNPLINKMKETIDKQNQQILKLNKEVQNIQSALKDQTSKNTELEKIIQFQFRQIQELKQIKNQTVSKNDLSTNKKKIKNSIYIKRIANSIFFDAFDELKFKRLESPSEAELFFYDGLYRINKYLHIDPSLYVSKIPGFYEICHKLFAFERFNSYLTNFKFFPTTFLHSTQNLKMPDFISKMTDHTTLIFKPNLTYGGKGIILFQGKEKLKNALDKNTLPNGIFQEYIQPKLINNHKFSVRLYLMITCLDPLSLFLYKEAACYFCAEEYKMPNQDNLTDLCSHLSCFSLNRQNERADISTLVRKYSDAILSITSDIERKEIWEKMKKLSTHAILALHMDMLRMAEEACIKNDESFETQEKIPYQKRFFHLLSLDVVIDSNLNPLLFDISDNPGNKSLNDVDAELKHSLIKDEFTLIFKYIRNEKIEVNVGGWEKII